MRSSSLSGISGGAEGDLELVGYMFEMKFE
jgi:hypothetical protein